MIQLTDEEADAYRDCPVFLDFSTGYYCFPVSIHFTDYGVRILSYLLPSLQPNEDNIVKMAIHGAGHIHTVAGVSTPRTVVTDPDRGLFIPKVVLKELRQRLAGLYPELATKPFMRTRLCWYAATNPFPI